MPGTRHAHQADKVTGGRALTARPAGHPRGGMPLAETPELEQRAEEFLVIAPAAYRALVELLAHLPGAGGQYGAVGAMEAQAPLVPGESDKVQNLASPT